MKCLLVSALFLISSNCYSQINHIKILIGQTDQEVTNYFDSLNSLKYNQYYKIKKDVSDGGNLILGVEFSISDESYYTCLAISVKFKRVQGTEICTSQYIQGNAEFATSNLNFVKDNFKIVSDNDWEMPYPNNNQLKIVATFEKKDGDYPFFVITYELQKAE